MDRKFDTTLQYGDNYTWLKIQGVVDEDNGLARLTSKVQGGLLVLDLAEVERINSCGVRDWVNWQHNVSATGILIVMIRCSPAIINQVNMVTNFIGEAVIHSFYAPYFNPETDEEKSVLLFTKDIIGQHPVRAPEVRDEETGYQLEFDDFEESYFAFANSATDPRSLDPNVATLVESLTPELGQHATSNAATTKLTAQGALDAAAAAAALAARNRSSGAFEPQQRDSDVSTARQVAPDNLRQSPGNFTGGGGSPISTATTAPVAPVPRAQPAPPPRPMPSHQPPPYQQPPPQQHLQQMPPQQQQQFQPGGSAFVTDPRATAPGAPHQAAFNPGVVPTFPEPDSRSNTTLIIVLVVVLLGIVGTLVWLMLG